MSWSARLQSTPTGAPRAGVAAVSPFAWWWMLGRPVPGRSDAGDWTMGYRGKDLNLQTADQARSSRGKTRSDTPATDYASDEDDGLLVDDAVLACCNHAYDLALAHRAAEVGLEHLLNAMTRTDAAVAVMANQGIDVPGLRHDTANHIASDEAMISGTDPMSPRRSQDLADALNLAADRAHRRHASVSVADVLQALLEMNREHPGLVMLKRNSPGWQQRNPNDAPRSEPLPPLLGGAYQIDPRYVQPDMRPGEPPREWVRVPMPQQAYYQAPPPGYFVAEAPPPPVGNVTDAVQNSRLDQLERTIRELSGELSAERKAFSQLVGELKRDVTTHTDTTSRLRGGLDDRLTGIEQMVMTARSEGTGTSPQTADRLASLERNVEAKFSDIARGWTILGERLQSLETAVMSGRGEGDMPAGFDNLGQALATLSDRMAGLERQLAAKPASSAAINLQPVVERLEALDTRIGQFERKLDTNTGGAERTTAQLADRLRSIEEAMVAQRNQVAHLATNLTSDVKMLGQNVSQALSSQSDAGERIQALVGDRLQNLTSTFERQRSDIATTVVQPLNERAGQITALVETHRNEVSQNAAAVSEQMSGMAKQIQSFGQRTLDLHAAHGKDLVELHDALVKLNTNQQTLAGSMDQWRLDNGTELGTLVEKLDGMERASARPVQMLENLQANVQTLQRFTAKREEQRSRFRQWLMGTDDWYGASWEEPEVKDRPRTVNTNGGARPDPRTAAINPPRPITAPPGNVRNNG
jgi:hypothetical protein